MIDRHDILRTAVAWEGLPEPVQVVWRQAPLPVEEVELDPAAGDAAEQLCERFDPRHYRMDVRQAPLMRALVARDAARGALAAAAAAPSPGRATTRTLEVLRGGDRRRTCGAARQQLPAPLPFRNFVAQARLGVSREEHEAFFREMLGDVDEPTAPFGLLDVQGRRVGDRRGAAGGGGRRWRRGCGSGRGRWG